MHFSFQCFYLYPSLLLSGEWYSVNWDSFCRKSLIDTGERIPFPLQPEWDPRLGPHHHWNVNSYILDNLSIPEDFIHLANWLNIEGVWSCQTPISGPERRNYIRSVSSYFVPNRTGMCLMSKKLVIDFEWGFADAIRKYFTTKCEQRWTVSLKRQKVRDH